MRKKRRKKKKKKKKEKRHPTHYHFRKNFLMEMKIFILKKRIPTIIQALVLVFIGLLPISESG